MSKKKRGRRGSFAVVKKLRFHDDVPLAQNIMNNTYILELSSARGSSMEKLASLLYYFVLCCILLVLIVYAAVLFGGPGVVGVIVLVLLIFDFRKYLRARR